MKKVGMPGSAVCVHWSPRINQLFVGVGDAKQGSTQVTVLPSQRSGSSGRRAGSLRSPLHSTPPENRRRESYAAMTSQKLRIEHVRVWHGATENEIPNFRGVRVALGAGYNRVEGNRRASRNGRVSDLPPKSELHRTVSDNIT